MIKTTPRIMPRIQVHRLLKGKGNLAIKDGWLLRAPSGRAIPDNESSPLFFPIIEALSDRINTFKRVFCPRKVCIFGKRIDLEISRRGMGHGPKAKLRTSATAAINIAAVVIQPNTLEIGLFAFSFIIFLLLLINMIINRSGGATIPFKTAV